MQPNEEDRFTGTRGGPSPTPLPQPTSDSQPASCFSTSTNPTLASFPTPQGPYIYSVPSQPPSNLQGDAASLQLGIPMAPANLSYSQEAPQYCNYPGPYNNQEARKNSKIQEVKELSKLARWIALFNCVTILFYAASGAQYLVFLILFPMLGYAGARIYHRCLCTFYMVFVGIKIVLDIVVMATYSTPLVIILLIFSIGINLFILRAFYKFLVLVSNLTTEEKAILLKVRYTQPTHHEAPQPTSQFVLPSQGTREFVLESQQPKPVV